MWTSVLSRSLAASSGEVGCWTVLRDKSRRHATVTQILLGISAVDLLYTIKSLHSTWIAPKEAVGDKSPMAHVARGAPVKPLDSWGTDRVCHQPLQCKFDALLSADNSVRME